MAFVDFNNSLQNTFNDDKGQKSAISGIFSTGLFKAGIIERGVPHLSASFLAILIRSDREFNSLRFEFAAKLIAKPLVHS